MSQTAGSCSSGARRAIGVEEENWSELREALGALEDNYCPVGLSESDQDIMDDFE